jgi:glycerophosphoryl diester phosphodiesterase
MPHGFMILAITYLSIFCSKLLARPIIIAHRGASGYLPEHTLEAKALAHGQNADYIEQDVVLTKDRHLVVVHDIFLDAVSDVAKKFPGRSRIDGRYYALDFTLDEVKQLKASERFERGTSTPVYKNRFPLGRSQFSIPTLDEEIELIQGLNRSTGKNVGIYVEIKSPAWHKAQGYDITQQVMTTLQNYGYPAKDKLAYIQCFDPETLIHLKKGLKSEIPLIQLIGENSWKESSADYEKMASDEGIKIVATYASGIGPSIAHLYRRKRDGAPVLTNLVKTAHQNNLKVHPYTARADALPTGIVSLTELFSILFNQLQVDGVFTDFPDQGIEFLNQNQKVKSGK